MHRKLILVGLALTMSAAFAEAPYSGLQTRAVKALSEQQMSDLRAGRGMGLALAAELNGYPGPSHLLELADKLDLSAEQRTRVSALFYAMRTESEALGARLIELETSLDQQFAGHTVTPASLKEITAAIASTKPTLNIICRLQAS